MALTSFCCLPFASEESVSFAAITSNQLGERKSNEDQFLNYIVYHCLTTTDELLMMILLDDQLHNPPTRPFLPTLTLHKTELHLPNASLETIIARKEE